MHSLMLKMLKMLLLLLLLLKMLLLLLLLLLLLCSCVASMYAVAVLLSALTHVAAARRLCEVQVRCARSFPWQARAICATLCTPRIEQWRMRMHGKQGELLLLLLLLLLLFTMRCRVLLLLLLLLMMGMGAWGVGCGCWRWRARPRCCSPRSEWC